MGLSEDDRKRIEEEEFRRALREKYDRELRVSADVRADTRSQVDVRGVSAHFVQADTSHQVEVRGVSTEIYRDAKRGAEKAGEAAIVGIDFIARLLVVLLYWLLVLIGAVFTIVGFVYLLQYGFVVERSPALFVGILMLLGLVAIRRQWTRWKRSRQIPSP